MLTSYFKDDPRGQHKSRNGARCLADHAVGTREQNVLDARHVTQEAQQIGTRFRKKPEETLDR